MYGPGQIHKILDSAGVRIANDVDSNFMVFCPFHHNVNTPAAEVDKATGVFFCFSCKHTCDLEQFLAKSTGMTYFQALRVIAKEGYRAPLSDEVSKLLEPEPDISPVDNSLIESLHNKALGSSRAMDYYHKRGITTESVIKHMFGYSEKQDMIIMPYASPSGDCFYGFEARSVEGKRFKANGPKTKTLFNLSECRWNNDVFVTESIIDAVLLEQAGASAVARMGTGSGKVQVGLLKRYFSIIYVVQDNDTASNSFAGQTSAHKLVEKLGNRGIMVAPPSGYKDIGDMKMPEVEEFVTGVTDITKGI